MIDFQTYLKYAMSLVSTAANEVVGTDGYVINFNEPDQLVALSDHLQSKDVRIWENCESEKNWEIF
jgi:hypothetical protein